MRTSRTYYEILGLPRTASLAQIRRRYKELVRKYHPDVATDKATAHRLFIQINEAYSALTDPVRRKAYDESLDLQARSRERAAAAAAQRTVATEAPKRSVPQMIKDAQWAFIQRKFGDAAALCKEVLRMQPNNGRAHAILGDIYSSQGKINSAIKYYSYALQFDPNERDVEKKLTKLMGKQFSTPKRRQESVSAPIPRGSFAVQNMVGWGFVCFLLMLISVYPGQPIPWLRDHFSPASLWSWNLVFNLAAASLVAGVLLSLNRLVAHPDEELVFDASAGGWSVVPSGLILLIGSGFFFIGAALFYLVVGIIQGSLSRSVLVVFACVAAVVGMAALMYNPSARMQVLLFGGNVSFFAMLIGWYIGAMLRPLGDY